jgi:septum formation protein
MASEPARDLILASGSAIRAAVMRQAGLSFRALAPDVDETAIKQAGQAASLSVERVAENLARAKAEAVVAQHPQALVVAADQMLEFDGRWLDKPASPAEAAARLREFSGRDHRLVSAMILQRGEETLLSHAASAELTVRALSDAFIESYIAAMGAEVCRSVGGYQLEGLGAQLFERVDGDFFTILGLPLLPLLAALRDYGVLPS